jgi:hypothetical protein
MGIKVESEVECYEVDGKEVEVGGDRPKIRVLSHWNRDELVTLKVGTKTYTVVGDHLERAIQNARNKGH